MDWPLIGQTSDNTSETLIGAIMRIVRIVTGPPIADFLKEIILKQEDAGDIQFYTHRKHLFALNIVRLAKGVRVSY